jgi:hypothetical protein
MKSHYLNPRWRYHGAASHANAAAFARRQHERMRAVKTAAQATVTPIKRRAAK